ncbi:MAG: VanZ family protein [Bacillaceae bacterium]|nr:VanZ family protein [Bacillaceae bacterium]
MKNKKSLTVGFIPILYFALFSTLIVREGHQVLFQLTSLLVNGLLVTFIIIWIFKKASIQTWFQFLLFQGVSVYLFVLHHLATFVPVSVYLDVHRFTGNFSIHYQSINVIPFHTITDLYFQNLNNIAVLKQLFGNILLLTPVVFSLMVLGICKKTGHGVLIALAASLAIEIVQFFETWFGSGFSGIFPRSTDIDDVIFNTLSGLIGAWMYMLIRAAQRLMKKVNARHPS